MKKMILLTICAAVLAGCLMGCGAAKAITENAPLNMAQIAEAQYGSGDDSHSVSEQRKEAFKVYEQFGLTYDAEKDELLYNGKLVRWFEDYYPIGDGNQAGRDFFNEKGAVDVYAVRDLSNFVKAADGSIDPSGKLTGLKEFTQAEFDARDVDAIKNPPPIEALAGDPVDAAEMSKIALEYKDFGVTYDSKEDQWYFNGEKVRYFRDVLTSNGESLNSGKFRGAMRTQGSGNGTVDIYTIRDFTRSTDDGNGVLTGIEAYTQDEFDAHTTAEKSDNSSTGTCVVVSQG